MRNWRLEAVDENIDIPVTFNPVSNSVVADVQELPASVHSLYWKAPTSYLGEKVNDTRLHCFNKLFFSSLLFVCVPALLI